MVRIDLQILPLTVTNGLIQLVYATEDLYFGGSIRGAQDRFAGKAARLTVLPAFFPAVSAIRKALATDGYFQWRSLHQRNNDQLGLRQACILQVAGLLGHINRQWPSGHQFLARFAILIHGVQLHGDLAVGLVK